MAKRDHKLLEAADLSIAGAAALFRRSRQALYTGLAHERPYFSAQDAMALVQHAKRVDSPRIDEVIRFISENYPASESELILPDQVGFERISRVIDEAEKIMLVLNGNTDNLAPTATFVRVLKALLVAQRPFILHVPGEWVIGYMEQNLNLRVPPSSVEVRNDTAYLPSFVMTEKQGAFRAFVCLLLSAEEMHPSEAARLWLHFAPKLSESVGGKSGEVDQTAARTKTSRNR